MAGADYKRCIVCGGKAFYDADISDREDYNDDCQVEAICSDCKHKWKLVAIRNIGFSQMKDARIKYRGGTIQ